MRTAAAFRFSQAVRLDPRRCSSAGIMDVDHWRAA
jgi:hypothetical protein